MITEAAENVKLSFGIAFGMTSETLQAKISHEEPTVTYGLLSTDIKLDDM